MNRVIKFRAWCLDNKWMEECFYIQAHNGVVFDAPSKTYDTPNIEIEENPNLVVMQFIGLTDKNGVDIYEGDIVKYSDEIIEVEFNDFMFRAMVHGECDAWGEYIDLILCEVIGNIHQNPELLT